MGRRDQREGHFWIATRPQWVGELSQAGAIVRTEGLGFWWWANIPALRWPNDPYWRQSLKRHWSDFNGDRRQEIVFIGTDMDEAAIRRRLVAARPACIWQPGSACTIRFPRGGAPARRRSGTQAQRQRNEPPKRPVPALTSPETEANHRKVAYE